MVFDNQSAIRNDVHLLTTNWFVNFAPLVSRLPRVPVGSTTFSIMCRKWIDGKPDSKARRQFCQTYVHPVSEWMHQKQRYVPDRAKSQPFDQSRMDALQCLVQDMEISSLYGIGEDPATMGRPKQHGLRNQIETNRLLLPPGAYEYTIQYLIRDALEPCRNAGGDPDVLLVSSDFVDGFATWGHPLLRINAGTNIFGEPIDVFECQALGSVTVIVDGMLRSGTAVAMTSSEVRLRMLRNEFWNPRGPHSGSDGEFVAEGAIEVENEHHHAWVEGIENFSPLS